MWNVLFLIRLRAQQRGITCATTAEIITGGSERSLKFKFPNLVFQFGRFFFPFIRCCCARCLSTFQEETQLKGRLRQLVQVYRFLHKAQVGKSRGSLRQPEVRTTEPVQSRSQTPTGRQQQIQTAAINKQNVNWGGKTKKRRKKNPPELIMIKSRQWKTRRRG